MEEKTACFVLGLAFGLLPLVIYFALYILKVLFFPEFGAFNFKKRNMVLDLGEHLRRLFCGKKAATAQGGGQGKMLEQEVAKRQTTITLDILRQNDGVLVFRNGRFVRQKNLLAARGLTLRKHKKRAAYQRARNHAQKAENGWKVWRGK